jgi:hypothetical protein
MEGCCRLANASIPTRADGTERAEHDAIAVHSRLPHETAETMLAQMTD